MEPASQSSTDTETAPAARTDAARPTADAGQQADPLSPEAQEALDKLSRAKERFLSAAVAFCDGLISEGQLRAVREMLREQEMRLAERDGEHTSPFVNEEQPSSPALETGVEDISEPPAVVRALVEDEAPADDRGEFQSKLAQLDEKIARLEADFQQGRINASQYRAIRRHYMEQHEVALRLHKANPASERWRVVLEEGKTSFLMQLNEAECRCIAIYDIGNRDCIHLAGDLPDEAEEAMRFLSTFGPPPTDQHSGRMFATQTDEGINLLLIPGRYTAALVAFSDEPPGWQVRALREVVRNFEAANQSPLSKGQRKSLVFPNLNRFFRD